MLALTLYMKESLCCCLLCDKVVHPYSLYRFSNDTGNKAGCYCNVCESCLEQPFHTTDAYSTFGSR